MKKVTLNIVFMKTWKMTTLCTSKNIGDYLKSVLKDRIVIEDNKLVSIFNIANSKKICWFILDDKNNLLTINHKVPKKLIILGINLDILKDVLVNYTIIKETIKICTYIKDEYDIELIPGLKELEEKEKVEIKLEKETIKEVIEPTVVIEKKEELREVIKVEEKEKVPKNEEKKEEKKEESKTDPAPEKKELVKEPMKKTKLEDKEKGGLKKEEKKEETNKKEEPKTDPEIKKEEKLNKKETDKELKKEEKPKEKIKQKIEKTKKEEPKKEEKPKKKEETKKEEKKDNTEQKPKELKIILNLGENKEKSKLMVLSSDDTISETKENKPKKEEEKDEPKEEKKNSVPNVQPQTITYTIVSPTGQILYNNVAVNSQPMTIQDMILATGLPITIETHSTNFVTSINGIKNHDMSGWVYEVNGQLINDAMNQYIMKPNDKIVWKYYGAPLEMTSEFENDTEEEKTQGGRVR